MAIIAAAQGHEGNLYPRKLTDDSVLSKAQQYTENTTRVRRPYPPLKAFRAGAVTLWDAPHERGNSFQRQKNKKQTRHFTPQHITRGGGRALAFFQHQINTPILKTIPCLLRADQNHPSAPAIQPKFARYFTIKLTLRYSPT